jgi:hypothetical protein
LRQVLAAASPKLLGQREVMAALEESADWPLSEAFTSSWFEDDDVLDRAIEAVLVKKKSSNPRTAIARILEDVLEKRRAVWLERLVLTTLWLKSSAKPPVPWHRMYHLAEAVAEETIPLKEIPLMVAIARLSFSAYLGRREEGRGEEPLSR